jgi:DNA polymerase-3 subunit delta
MLAQELLDALDRTKAGALAPVLVAVGEETYLVERVARRVRAIAAEGGVPGFNEDRFVAGECDAASVVGAARMLPMMAPLRFVHVRDVERWEAKGDDGEGAKSKRAAEPPLDQLAAYAANPNPSTVLLVTGAKLHAQRRLVTAAKKGGFWVACDPLKKPAAVTWTIAESKRAGSPLGRETADHLVDAVGTELGLLADAVERLALYVGPGKPIGDDAVAAVIAPVKASAIWDLTDAIAARELPRVMSLLAELDLARGADLQTLGAIASSVRKLARVDDRLAAGDDVERATLSVGIPRFRAHATRDVLRRLPRGTLARWVRLLADADAAMKGGSPRSGRAVLETTVLAMLRGA